ncbi:glycogen synthase [Chondromyces apiculatus]|uniref:Glycogen synthase n=1 Tax=Chondromyces apiculatus DSM 436 TaxID=1192034 RepID=A0A017T564_9BACT|nr:glycogen/starch synthase [Chondromyces apiculatus]EYF03950.1 Glycogen synthase, ADP-glucose transglucosylase [Chondromyces apiculatus DSM 436]
MARLKILFAVSECVPFAKTGGLADVAGALPTALAAQGHDVRVVMPRYRSAMKHLVDGSGAPLPGVRRHEAPLGVPLGGHEVWTAVWEARVDASGKVMRRVDRAARAPRVYLLEHGVFFDRDGVYGDSLGEFGDNLQRFTLLSRGALSLCKALSFVPDVVHVHDWQTALVPVYLNTLERDTELGQAASVLTIHNMGYQGWFEEHLFPLTGLGWEVFREGGLAAHHQVNLLQGGLHHATLISTVSPRYAQEIRTPQGGEGLDWVLQGRGGDVVGILNGIDDAVWNPATDEHLAARYSAEDLSGKQACKAALQREMGLPERADVPLLGVVSRLANQKGIDVLAGALGQILSMDVQVVVLGSGEGWAEELFRRLSASGDRFRAHIGMNEGLAHRIEAGADLFLMPSRYEPCGLNQLYSQRYGTLPVVRAVGGLDDTVDANLTGFKFGDLSVEALAQTVAWAVHAYRTQPERFREMQLRAMRKPLGWAHASRQYEALYRLAVARRQGRGL